MDFSILPNWPQTLPGETKQSWMSAAGLGHPLEEGDWWELVQPSHREPERPREGMRWEGLPIELGDIATIAPSWRLAAGRRRVFCPSCFVGEGDRKRWPTRIYWIDARQLQCDRHGRPLVYRDPAFGVDLGHAGCQAQPELLGLYAWTRQWIHLDQSDLRAARLECQWRRDLVHMVCRNWTTARCHSAAGLGAWELWRMGWYAQEKSGALAAGCPARLGELSAPERLGSLLLAYRGWRCFRREAAAIPPLPRVAWMWLAHRWTRRLEGRQRKRFLALVGNLMKHA